MPSVTAGGACDNCGAECIRLLLPLPVGRWGQANFDHQSANGDAITIL
jgi:hypothetical protein